MMTILVQNTTDDIKYIYRFSGIKLQILPKDFVTFECDNIEEAKYWTEQINKTSKGINVVTNSSKIQCFKKLKSCGKYDLLTVKTILTTDEMETNTVETNSETAEMKNEDLQKYIIHIDESHTFLENSKELDTEAPVIEDIDEPIYLEEEILSGKISEEELPLTEVSTTDKDEDISHYTEEYLNTLSKTELQDILDNMNIPYKKNNSLNTLVALILEHEED